jgi:hypothetical protein
MTIKLNVDGNPVELTVDQARALFLELKQVFGDKDSRFSPAPMPEQLPAVPSLWRDGTTPTPWWGINQPWCGTVVGAIPTAEGSLFDR